MTPTAARYKDRPSQVAPLSGPREVSAARAPLETRQQVEAALAACRMRLSHLPLVEENKARALLPAGWSQDPLPEWMRLLANFPKAGTARIVGLLAAEDKGALNRLLKSQVAWIAAREDRAWYALGRAHQRLAAQGLSDDAIYALDGPWDTFTPAEQRAFAFARKLTSRPTEMVDGDIADLRKHYGEDEVAELVFHIANAAFFDRVTEACGLRLEDKK